MAKPFPNRVAKALTNALLERGCDKVKDAHLFSMIDDYMSLWKTKEMLNQDIAERGVQIPWQNGESSHGFKKNDSVDSIVKVNAQMLKILAFLKMDVSVIEQAQVEEETEDGL